MDTARYAARREKLRRLMHAENLGALFVTLDANRYYLSGFELHDHQIDESSGFLLINKNGNDWLCTDSRYHDAAKRIWDENRILVYSAGVPAAINKLVQSTTQGTVGFESAIMSVRFHAPFAEGLDLKPADGLVEKLRIIKEPEEIILMQASAILNHKLMEWLPSALVPGRTEREIAWDVERFFRENGAESLSFPTIAAVGPNAALPHAVPGPDTVTENSCVLIDTGCRLHDYCSDQTRTFWVGDRPSDSFMQTITQVRTAQEKAIAVIRPGAVCSDIYAVARKSLEDDGVAAFFTHGLGHGVGLQVHEEPRLNSRSTAVLEPGMIITVEPGLYYPEWGGVRWEYMVLVTEEGCRII